MPRRALILLGLLLFGCGAHTAILPAATPPSTPADAPAGAVMLWPAPPDPLARMAAAQITPLPAMATAFHIHVHLDVYKDGQQIVVPANIGLDDQDGLYSSVHTHFDTGILHIENPVKADFTLGQFFTLWNVPLAGAIAYVNGVEQANPSALVLTNLAEIAVIFGTPPAEIPSVFPGVDPSPTPLGTQTSLRSESSPQA